MKNGIYTSTAGMMAAMERLDVLANNIANVDTPGFKADIPFEQVLRTLGGGAAPGKEQPILAGSRANLAAATVKTTGRPLDLAFTAAEGFFAIRGPDGQTLYTRNGSFSLNSQRDLVTSEGYPVLDTFGKPIRLVGEKVEFAAGGEIHVDGQYLTRLKVVNIQDASQVEKVGYNLFRYLKEGEPGALATPAITTGSLEAANVNIVGEMVSLIQVQRAFEFQSRALDTILNQSLKRTVSDLPRPV